ncbi:hypothetical protein BDV98DRAFT_568823 [Pterulicium gracile]|uniref:Uncharacterized protein n=1 Tax=Pterulicium gracile TaxID=1884261 RepID=A0A5C3QK60_9AGAR|nr:hypothetical protein BDV98DRAFT_568823 [Pterula gracilis]
MPCTRAKALPAVTVAPIALCHPAARLAATGPIELKPRAATTAGARGIIYATTPTARAISASVLLFIAGG